MIIDYTAFGVGGLFLLTPATHIKEIINVPVITRLPESPKYVLGMMNWRGRVIAVINTYMFFGQEAPEDLSKCRILVCDFKSAPEAERGEPVGFLVERHAAEIRLDDEMKKPKAVTLVFEGLEMVECHFLAGDKLYHLIDLLILRQMARQ